MTKIGKILDLTHKLYRPIGLTSFLLKTIERLLSDISGTRHLRTDLSVLVNMHIKPGKSTNLPLEDLNRLLSKSLYDKEIVIATFLYIDGAFNNASM